MFRSNGNSGGTLFLSAMPYKPIVLLTASIVLRFVSIVLLAYIINI